MKEREYWISLNRLTAGERFGYPDTFKEYANAVVAMLRVKDNFIFEDELIQEYKADAEIQKLIKSGMSCMDAINLSYPDRFVNAGKHRKSKEEQILLQAWFDLWNEYEITSNDFLYDLFFAYWIRQNDLLKFDELLNSYLENDYDNNKMGFIRFLKLTLRKHSKKLLQQEQIETINEWIAEKEQETVETKTKGKIKRTRDDNVTKLNQEQTAILIHFLQTGKIILKGEYLNNKEAGQAFSVLTGYSADSLRQNLSENELQRISTKKNMDIITNALTNLQLIISKEKKDKN